MMYDELFIEARREDIRRDLQKVFENRRNLDIVNAGRPAPAKSSLLTLLFGVNRNQSPVEYLEPVPVRIRND